MTIDLMLVKNRCDIISIRDGKDQAQHEALRNTADNWYVMNTRMAASHTLCY